ncbi:YqcI/YcgG family protein [Bacillota bacterium Lsc_1132]
MLLTKEAIQQTNLDPWKKDAFEKFEAKISDKHKSFPCIPATLGLQLNHFRYGFVKNPYDASSSTELAQLLEAYSNNYREIGAYTSLIIFYESSQDLLNLSVEQFEQIFWSQLSRICEMDDIKWPSHIPQDPHDPLWEFCFHGEQYFMYCATPSHKNRMSRYFPYLMLAVTPRWVLEQFNAFAPRTSKIKANIRKRLAEYDSIPIHPDLKTYGQKDNYEWKQYFLHDDDTALTECPFHKFLKTNKVE